MKHERHTLIGTQLRPATRMLKRLIPSYRTSQKQLTKSSMGMRTASEVPQSPESSALGILDRYVSSDEEGSARDLTSMSMIGVIGQLKRMLLVHPNLNWPT